MNKKKLGLASGFELPPKPTQTPVDEKAAKEFVVVDERESKLRRESRGERLAVYIPMDLATKLRVHCAQERRSLSDVVTSALREMKELHG